jgi:hypothetical protein
MSTTSYTSPVDKLFTLGKAEPVDWDRWPNYLELGLSLEHVPELIRMATDLELRGRESIEVEDEDPKFWAPVHALRALGQLHAEDAAETLVNMLAETKNDSWIQEELPQIYVLIGPAAIPALREYLADSTHDEYSRGFAAESLEAIAKKYPETRSECLTAISKQLESFEDNDYELNAFLICSLSELKAIETLPLIKRAFEAERVDDFIIGLDYVLEEFGLKERREIPDSFESGDFFKMFKKRGSSISPDQFEIVSPDTPDSTPPTQKAQPSSNGTTRYVTKFSGKRITKKNVKKKR